MNSFLRPTLGIAALALWTASSAHAQFILNGDLELLADGTPIFESWTNNAGVSLATQAIGGDYSARIVRNAGSLGNALHQNVSGGLTQWTVSFDIAANASARSMQLNIRTIGGSDSGQINLIVATGTETGMGTVQVFNGSSWVTAVANAFTLSTAESGEGFNVNTISLSGDYGAAQPNYTVSVNGITSSVLTAFQGTVPTNPTLAQIAFQSGNVNEAGWSVIDNVSVIPEPGTYAAVLGAFALAGGVLLRRRRK